MSYPLKLLILMIFYCRLCSARHGQIINQNDISYDVINFKVPRTVWNQALNPTPVLKSSVTITLPIHVAEDDQESDIDYINNETENVSEPDGPEGPLEDESTLVSDEPVLVSDEPPLVSDNPALVSNQPIVPVTSETVTESVLTSQAPVLQEEVTEIPTQDVNGQVTRFPCTCGGGQCGCCTGTILQRFKMKACGNMSFVPEDFVFDVRLTVNNRTVVRRRVSASDPPPICFNPRRAPFVRVCAEISNIRIRNGNAFACLDINADIASFPIYSASFRCFSLGSSGLQTGLKPKPVSSGPKPVNLFGTGSNDNGGTILDAAGSLLGGGSGGIFGGGGGPLDAIGDAVGDFLGRSDFD